MVTVDSLLGFLAATVLLCWVLSGPAYAIFQPYRENLEWPCFRDLHYEFSAFKLRYSIIIHVKAITFRFKRFPFTTATSVETDTPGTILKLLIEIETPHVQLHPAKGSNGDDYDQLNEDILPEKGTGAVRAMLKYVCGSPTFNRLISFFLRRTVVDITDAKVDIGDECTLLVDKSTLFQNKVYLRSPRNTVENDVYTDDHKESLKMSKSFIRYKLRRGHAAILNISQITLVTGGGPANTDFGVVFAAQPFQLTASTTLPRKHNERHRISFGLGSSDLQVNMKELSTILAGLRNGDMSSGPKTPKSFIQLEKYLEGVHVKLDEVTLLLSHRVQVVLNSLYLTGTSAYAGVEEEEGSTLALTISETSVLWGDSSVDSWKLAYTEALQLEMARGYMQTAEDPLAEHPNSQIACIDVGLHIVQPTFTVSYDVLKPLKADILDMQQRWKLQQEQQSSGETYVNGMTGIFHSKMSATNAAFRIKDANDNIIAHIDAAFIQATMDRILVEAPSEPYHPPTPEHSNSSDTLVDSWLTSQSSVILSQKAKVEYSLEIEELTTWKECQRYLHGLTFSPAACNYFSMDRFHMNFTNTESGTMITKPSSHFEGYPTPTYNFNFGYVHIDIRDAPYLMERIIPWVSLISDLTKRDSQVPGQPYSTQSVSPFVRIMVSSVDFSFLTIDKPLNKDISIPPAHFCNAPLEEIGCGVLFSAADLIFALPHEGNTMGGAREGMNSMSISCKEVSLCSLMDTAGENFIFVLGEEPISWVPNLTVNVREGYSSRGQRKFETALNFDMPLLQFCWAPQSLYCVLSLVKCVKDTMVLFFHQEWIAINPLPNDHTDDRSLRVHITAQNLVGRFSLAPTMKLQMEISDGAIEALPNQTMIAAGDLRFYGTANHGKTWKRLLHASHLKLNQVGNNGSDIILQSIHFRLPYNYVCATIVEAAIHAWKLTKTLFSRLVRGRMIEWQGPSDKSGAFNVPSFQLRVQQFTFEFEDDPFESKLRLFWKTSLNEQPRRMKTEEAFMAKANSMCEEPENSRSGAEDQGMSDSLKITAMIADLKSKRHSSKIQPDGQFVSQNVESDKSKNAIEAAWQRLQEYNSKCWISEITSAMRQEESSTQRHREVWYQSTSKKRAASPDFFTPSYRLDHSYYCQDSLDISADSINPYSPLLGISVDNLTIDITSPSFSLDSTTAFVQDVGEGVPLDTEYSILLPFRMYCSGAKTSISIRDYPLPLLRVPEDKSARRDFQTAWTLAGDFVIADELGDVAGAWLKPMDLVPERKYTVNLLRVASPLKFFSIVDIEVHTPEVTYIAWSMSIQPAIEDIIRVIDSFTPSPIDPSPKLGFWDKVRLMVHTRTRIRFLGQGDLALWMKGKKDPYSLSATGSGIIKVWRRGVECRLGYTNSENELLQIFSDEYILAVPTLDFDDSSSPSTESGNKGMFYIEEPQEYAYDQKYQKTVLSLTNGVRWGLACHFERFCRRGCIQYGTNMTRGNCKILCFEPHYSVVYRTPESVKQNHIDENDYDSFDGFRSSWIHLSFTVSNTDYSSGSQASANALRLTPKFIGHFLDWFALFGGENGLPIRTGQMFPREDHRPTQKFGKHLSTLRYQIVLNCLFLSLIYKDEESGFEGDFLGFKANVKSFILDIHQQRENMQTDHHLLGSRSTSKWPMYEGEVILDTMDIRGILATYMQSQSPNHFEYDTNDEGHDKAWIDQLDYCELEIPAIVLPPVTKLLPFVTTPYLCLRKQAKQVEKEQNVHLHGVHRCYIGNSPSTRDVQIGLHKERFNVINDHVRKVEVEIAEVEARIAQNPNDTELLGESLSLLESMATLYEKKRQLSLYLQEILEDDRISPSTRSVRSINGGSLVEWEQLMGAFQKQFVLHNPCIIWSNEIRNLVYRFMDLRERSNTRNLLISTKTLRSLINASTSQLPNPANQSEPIIDTTESDQSTFFDILERLVSVDGQQNVALSECDEWHPSIESSPDTVSDMNDPQWQKKSLSGDHQIKNNYTLDLLNPQILFKSKQSPSGILVSAERAHMKGLTIFNSSSRDPDTDYIEARSLCSIENSQFFIVKNSPSYDRVSILDDLDDPNTLPWIPLEALADHDSLSKEYERVASGVSATLQYDAYNKLSMEPSQHPFEENANGVRLHFPAITLSVNSAQYNILYNVLKDLLLYSEPAKVDRQASLQEMMFISDLDTLPYVLDAAVLLKDNIRQHHEALLQYHQFLSVLTEEQFEQYTALSKSYFELHDELYLLMESIKIAQSDRQSVVKFEAKTALKFEVIANKVSWKMIMATASNMFEWDLTHLNFMWLGKEDRSVKYKLELDKIVMRNEGEDYPVDLIGPYFTNERKFINFSKHKMLQGYLVETASVGGIPVVEHMEIKLAPIKLNMTYDIAKALSSYLFPPEKRYQDLAEPSDFVPVLHDQAVAFQNAANAEEEPTASAAVGSPKKRRALSLGKLSDFYGRVRRTEWNSPIGDDSTINTVSEDISPLNRPRRWSAVNLWWNEITVMRKRASNTRCFIYVKMPGAKHCLTYKGPKNRNFEDLNNFVFKQPTIELRNRTCSWFELLELIKREIMLAALLHSGSLIKEKILPKGSNRPLSWHSQRSGRWSFSRSSRSLIPSSSSEDSTIDDSEDDARSMISSFSRAEDDFDSTHDLSIGSNRAESLASRPTSMISDSTKKQKWTQKLAKRATKAPRFQKFLSHTPRRRASHRSAGTSSEVMEKGRMLLGKQYDGPFNRTSREFDMIDG